MQIMAYLLGSEFCIESLRNDVADLQTSVTDVFSRAGPIKSPSWKYPDKPASEVNIEELLERYDFSDDEEERQVAHIILMELVIDRLVLLLQSMSQYLDQILTLGRTGSTGHQTTSNSIGLIVKKYWNKMIHTYTVITQLQSENKSKNRKIADMENTITKLTRQLEEYKEGGVDLNNSGSTLPLSARTVDVLSKSGFIDNLSRASTRTKYISEDEYNKSTQTVETAFVPCEGCHKVQKNLREMGEFVVNICKSQELPSSLMKYKALVEDLDWMSSNDISRWNAEQSKDLARINKHLEHLLSTIGPLKDTVATEQDKCRKLEIKMAECQKQMKVEKETLSAQSKQFSNKMKEVENKQKEEIRLVEVQKQDVIQGKNELSKQLDALKSELKKQEECMNILETAKKEMEKELLDSKTNNATVRNLEANIESLQQDLTDVNNKLDSASKELNKEKAKNKSVAKHQQSLQGKQDSLLQRIDALDQENEEIRGQVADLEDQKDSLEEALDRAEEEKHQLQAKAKQEQEMRMDLQREKERMEESIAELEESIGHLEGQLQEAKDREKLMVEYPDLNGPVNTNFAGTGDVTVDMENQVKANSLRIKVLEDQNASLRNSITKMLQTQSRSKTNEQAFATPVMLWQPPAAADYQHREDSRNTQNDNSPSSDDSISQRHKHQPSPPSEEKPPLRSRKGGRINSADKSEARQSFVVSRPPSAKSGSKSEKSRSKGRPSSGSKGKDTSTSSIAALLQLRKSGLIRKEQLDNIAAKEQRQAEEPPGGKSGYQKVDVVICSKCDKMYNSKMDLEIHNTYCFGGV